MTTLEWSETGFEGPANERVGAPRDGLPEILAFNIIRFRARTRPAAAREPGEPVVIDARTRFRGR